MVQNSSNYRKAERGNVLFLIMIAVVLFGFLSFAATQSTRSGGTDVGMETDKMSNSSLIQYASFIKATTLRMTMRNDSAPENLEFNPPSEFSNCTSGFKRCVFHPMGGGANYVKSDEKITYDGTAHDWVFNGENEINLFGTSTGDDSVSPSTADLIAFLPGLSKRFCQSINDQADIAGIPQESGIIFTSASDMVNPDGATSTSFGASGATIGSPTGTNVAQLDGKMLGCFEQGGTYVYFHMMVPQ